MWIANSCDLSKRFALKTDCNVRHCLRDFRFIHEKNWMIVEFLNDFIEFLFKNYEFNWSSKIEVFADLDQETKNG